MDKKRERCILRVLNYIDDTMNLLIRLAIIPVFLCGLYIIADTIGIYSDAGADKVKAYKPEVINEEALQEINGNCIAWLEIDDTTIDYPVMQGEDNLEYLNKDPYGNYSLAGSIFMDFRNSPDFTDEYNLIYGHHMSAGLMFGAFDKFTDEEYFRNHLNGKLTVGDKEYKLHIYCFLRCDASHSEVFNTTYPMDERLSFYEKQAWYTDGSLENKTVVALTTCKAPGATDRTVLMCWIEE